MVQGFHGVGETGREGEATKLLQFRESKQSVPKLRSISTPPHSPPSRCKTTGALSLPALEDLFIYKGHRPLPSPRLGLTQGATLHSPPHAHSGSNFQRQAGKWG